MSDQSIQGAAKMIVASSLAIPLLESESRDTYLVANFPGLQRIDACIPWMGRPVQRIAARMG